MRAVNLSQSHKSEKKKDDAGKKERKKESPKKNRKTGQLKNKTNQDDPHLKKKKLSAFPSTELCLRSSLALSSAELMRMSGRRSFWMWS